MVARCIVLLCLLCLPCYGQKAGFFREKPVGNAVDLNGSDEYLSESVALPLNGASNVTICAWVYFFAQPAANAYPVAFVPVTAANLSGMRVDAIGLKLRFGARSTSADSFQSVTTAAAVTSNTWHHVVCVLDYSSKKIWGYVDGVLTASNTAPTWASTTYVNASGGNITTGTDISNPLFLMAKVDELAFYRNRSIPISTVEVTELYNAGRGKRIEPTAQFNSTGRIMGQGLVRLWHLDESGAATNAVDSSGNGGTAAGVNIGSGDWVPGKVKLP